MLSGNPIELLLPEQAQVRPLGHALTKQAVRVLAGAALPRAVRVAEVDLHDRLGSQRFCRSGLRRAEEAGSASRRRKRRCAVNAIDPHGSSPTGS